MGKAVEVLTSTFSFEKPPKIDKGFRRNGIPVRNAQKHSLHAHRKAVKVKSHKLPRIKQIPLKTLVKKADELFSIYTRNRDSQRGCYATEILEEKGKCKSGFNCCHLFGRGKYDIRWDEFNGHGGCFYHNQIHDHTFRPQPHIMTGWFIRKFGFEKYEELRKRSYIVRPSSWIRLKALEIIEKYESKSAH